MASPDQRSVWRHLLTVTRPLFARTVRWQSFGAIGLIVALLLSLNGMNVVNSYVGRGFMSALAERDSGRFFRFALYYAAVFAGSTVVAVFYQYAQDRLALYWRQALTRRLLGDYLTDDAYYRVNMHAAIDNPDQRMAEDVKTFTANLLSFAMMLLNATVTTIAFAVILWSISGWLLASAFLYAGFGSLVTFVMAYRLIDLENLQLSKEANLRYSLIRVREYAEPIALLHGEPAEEGHVQDRLRRVVANFKAIVTVVRNVGFFTSGFNYLVPILPVIIVAPAYLNGEIEFGVVTQSAMAFAQLLGALAIFVAQFQSVSSFTAVVRRLGSLWDEIQMMRRPVVNDLHFEKDDTRVAFANLTLRTPRDGRVLIRDLTLEVPRGRRLLVVGQDGAGKSALFRATAGLWTEGQGTIFSPQRDLMMFVPPRPYIVYGSVRDQLLYGLEDRGISDEQLQTVIHKVKLDAVVQRIGGIGSEHDWNNTLSIGEQQLFAFARMLLANPRFAFLDQSVNALGPDRGKQLYRLLATTSITYLSVGDHTHIEEFHDMMLELHEDGSWSFRSRPTRKSA